MLLIGSSESIIRELFRQLLRNNLRKIKSKDEITFTLSEVKKARTDEDFGDMLLLKLEDEKNPAEKLNFQNMKQFEGIMNGYFEIKIDDQDLTILHEFWQKRHIIIHNSSIIDKRFIKNLQAASIDTLKYKEGELIKVTMKDFKSCKQSLAKLFTKIDVEITRLGLRYGG